MRKRPNYFENRHNQWIIAGKIAVKTGAINPCDGDGNIYPIYEASWSTWREPRVDYALIGQDYLRQLGLEIEEL